MAKISYFVNDISWRRRVSKQDLDSRKNRQTGKVMFEIRLFNGHTKRIFLIKPAYDVFFVLSAFHLNNLCIFILYPYFLYMVIYVIFDIQYTICPGSSDPFYIVGYYIKWVTISWTHSIIHIRADIHHRHLNWIISTIIYSFAL